MAVESSVVQLAQSQAVRDNGISARLAVGNDVGGGEELFVAQAAESALFAIGLHYLFAEGALVQALLHGGGDVDTPGFIIRFAKCSLTEGAMEDFCIVGRHLKGEPVRVGPENSAAIPGRCFRARPATPERYSLSPL